MSSIDRPLSGDALFFVLDQECAHVREPDLLTRHGRNARTLAKENGLRVTVVAVAPGGEIVEHHADGPISVHVLEGTIRFRAQDKEHFMEAGSLLTLPAGIRHSISSERGGVFLLTVCQPSAVG